MTNAELLEKLERWQSRASFRDDDKYELDQLILDLQREVARELGPTESA